MVGNLEKMSTQDPMIGSVWYSSRQNARTLASSSFWLKSYGRLFCRQ
jgi:hypothetical protein